MKKSVILLLFAVALTGCRGESTLTGGGYGASTISGQVSLSGVANTNPAGVQVSVRGTGMTATLGVDGRFAFGGAPAEAVLDFRRAADGIEASLALAGGSGFVSVDLRPTKAVALRALRIVPVVSEYQGRVVRMNASELVIRTSEGEATFLITDGTVIRNNSASFNMRLILEGVLVVVQAMPEPDGKNRAMLIDAKGAG